MRYRGLLLALAILAALPGYGAIGNHGRHIDNVGARPTARRELQTPPQPPKPAPQPLVAKPRPALDLASRGVSPVVRSFYWFASWYGPGFVGSRTASGETFNPDELTAASPWLPFGSKLLVTDLVTGKSVQVVVNDRGPYVAGRQLDLSEQAAKDIGLSGVDRVRVQVLP